MRRFIVLSFLTFFAAGFLASHDGAAARYWQKKDKKSKTGSTAVSARKDAEKPFADLVKGFDKISGLFDFYVNKKDNQVYMAVKPEQLNKVYLCNMTRSAGDGSFLEGSVQTNEFPFEIRQIGKRIQLIQRSLRFRVDTTAQLSKALNRSISNSVFGSATVASLPDSGGAVLIDPTPILVTDADNIGYFLGKMRQTEFSFDKDNSYFGSVKSFPQNSEVDVILHYKSNKPNEAVTLSSPYSMFLTYHYSFSNLPETDYRPRLADDRVGYFTTVYQDYTQLDAPEPYVRYINRWHLEKKDPNAAVSEPKQPIVFWIENTTPAEYRDDIREGVLFWNKAFEKAGFRDAIVCKDMPDTADWDPADVRFSTIRWTVWPTQRYGAVGQSRANPYTGQIYDTDIMIVAGTIRNVFNYAENFIEPISSGKATPHSPFALSEDWSGSGDWRKVCNHAEESSRQAAEGLALLQARSSFEGKSELTKKYVRQYIRDLASHEVGHTLGLRHNFRASTTYTREQLNDPEFVSKNGVVGAVMEYAPPNLCPIGAPQTDFYNSEPGPWDIWAIEYGYKPLAAADQWEEKAELEKIASRAPDPLLTYGTDEDCFGNGPRAIDPYVAQHDLGSDPLEYWKMRISLSKELWSRLEKEFEKPGQNYRKLRTVFGYGWGAFSAGGSHIARFIGGIRNYRDHVGDPNGRLPFEPISAARQREAMKFLVENVWSANAFQFPATFLNKLQPERMEDFTGSAWNIQRIDYPLHDQVLSVQRAPLTQIFNPVTLARLNDIGLRYDRGQDVYTMSEVFQDIRRAIWSEVIAAKNVGSMRRNLQRFHLGILVDLVTNVNLPVPEDAKTLARVDLRTLRSAINSALASGGFDSITRGHLEDSLARVNAALDASINLKI